MKKIVVISSLISSLLFANNTFEYKDDNLRIRISKDSVNRIVLPFDIKGKIFSMEKNLKVETNGKEAYIKIIPQTIQEQVGNEIVKSELQYPEVEAEVFFVTDKKTYSITFVPDAIDSRTIYVTDNIAIKEDIIKIEKNSTEYDKSLKHIFKLAINNELSNSYSEIVKNEQYPNFYFISEFEGINYNLFKFFLKDNSTETIETINKSIKNGIVATCIFENNYYVLGVRNVR